MFYGTPYKTGTTHATSIDHLVRETEAFWMHQPSRKVTWHPGNIVSSRDYLTDIHPTSASHEYFNAKNFIYQDQTIRQISANNLRFALLLELLQQKHWLGKLLNYTEPIAASVECRTSSGFGNPAIFYIELFDTSILQQMVDGQAPSNVGVPYVPAGVMQYPSGWMGPKRPFEFTAFNNGDMMSDLTYNELHTQTLRDLETFYQMMDRA
jgi:hypothetical protein